MTANLLKTKFHIPPARAEWVQRPRLLDRLNASLQYPLTLVSAPAGFGKSTLLSAWLHIAAPHAAWLSLDTGDDDLVRFVGYLCAALQTIHPDVGIGTQALLTASRPVGPDALMISLINDLTAVQRHFVLILDDYHVINAGAVHDVVTFLLDHLPTPMHLIIASRSDPPLPSARLRARDQLNELRAADLRFSTTEISDFLNVSMGLNLDESDIAVLEERTEGWIAGLQLAALSMQKQEDIPAFVASFSGSHRFILDYLTEEVLNKQCADMQSFLLQTSILNRLCGPLCMAVTQQSESQTQLEELDTHNLFLVPLDDNRQWYRYHHLFANLLRARLEQAQPDLVPELHDRASAWYEQHGYISEALEHAQAAGDRALMVDLLARHVDDLILEGDINTVQYWLNACPVDMVRKRPELCIASAWTWYLTGSLEGIEAHLHQAETALAGPFAPDDQIETARQFGVIATLRAHITRELDQNPQAAVTIARQALDRLPSDAFERGLLLMTLGGAWRAAGDLAGANRYYAKALEYGRAFAPFSVPTMFTVHHLVRVALIQGQLRHALALCQDTIAAAHRQFLTGQLPPMLGIVYASLAYILYEQNELDAARQQMMTAIELGKQSGNFQCLIFGYLVSGLVLQTIGETEESDQAMRKATQLGHETNWWYPDEAVTMRMRFWLMRGDLDAARHWASTARVTSQEHPSIPQEFVQIALARLLQAEGKHDPAVYQRAMDVLAGSLITAESSGHIGHVIELLALQSMVYEAVGQDKQALSALQRALQLAAPEGYVRVFVEHGAPMWRLLRHAHRCDATASYAADLLAAYTLAPLVKPKPQKAEGLLPHLVDPLSEREVEVLQLVAAGLTNRQIAERLVLSLSTVKVHNYNIYQKLGVKSRTQAIAKATALGIL